MFQTFYLWNKLLRDQNLIAPPELFDQTVIGVNFDVELNLALVVSHNLDSSLKSLSI